MTVESLKVPELWKFQSTIKSTVILTNQRPVLVKNVFFYSILWYSHSVCNFHSKYTNNMPVNRQYIFGQILTNQRPVFVEDVLFLTQFYDIHTQCAISFQNIPITCLLTGKKILAIFWPIRGLYSLKTYFFHSISWYSYSVCNFLSKYTNNTPVVRSKIFDQIFDQIFDHFLNNTKISKKFQKP